MYSKSFVEGEGGVPINPPPLNVLENSHLLNSQCKILKKGLGHPTPLANKIIAETLLEKKILDPIMQLIICINVKQK